MDIDRASEAVSAMEKSEEKTGLRKWFKRANGDGKRKSPISGTKKRSGSVFARLCWVSKKKEKSKPYIELVRNTDDTDGDRIDQSQDGEQIEPQPIEASDTSLAKESESYPESPMASDMSTIENATGQGPTNAEIEFNAEMAELKRTWFEFGDHETMKASEPEAKMDAGEAEVRAAAEMSTEINDDAVIKRMVDEAASLALGSCDQDLPSMLPVGTEWVTSNCPSYAWMTRVSNTKEGGAVSEASAKGIKPVSSCESEGKQESTTAQSVSKSSSSVSPSSVSDSSVYSTTVSTVSKTTVPIGNESGKTSADQDPSSDQIWVRIRAIVTTQLSESTDDSSSSEEESVSVAAGSAMDVAGGKSLVCCVGEEIVPGGRVSIEMGETEIVTNGHVIADK